MLKLRDKFYLNEKVVVMFIRVVITQYMTSFKLSCQVLNSSHVYSGTFDINTRRFYYYSTTRLLDLAPHSGLMPAENRLVKTSS